MCPYSLWISHNADFPAGPNPLGGPAVGGSPYSHRSYITDLAGLIRSHMFPNSGNSRVDVYSSLSECQSFFEGPDRADRAKGG